MLIVGGFLSSTVSQIIAGVIVLLLGAVGAMALKNYRGRRRAKIAKSEARWNRLDAVCDAVENIETVLVGKKNPLTPFVKTHGLVDDVADLKNQMAFVVADKKPNGGNSSRDSLNQLLEGQKDIKKTLDQQTLHPAT